MYTNICSLNANVKHLDILLHQLDFSFELLAVLETWTTKSDHVKNIPRLENYQSFVGTKVGAVSTIEIVQNINKERP